MATSTMTALGGSWMGAMLKQVPKAFSWYSTDLQVGFWIRASDWTKPLPFLEDLVRRRRLRTHQLLRLCLGGGQFQIHGHIAVGGSGIRSRQLVATAAADIILIGVPARDVGLTYILYIHKR